MSPELPTVEDLQELERAVQFAFHTGHEGQLEVLGYGEISSTLRWRSHACKRLPTFDDDEGFRRYRDCFETYLRRLGEAGITAAPSRLLRVEPGPGLDLRGPVAYCVQPAFDADALLPRVLGRCDEQEALGLFASVQDHMGRVISPRVGLDGQASNWVVQSEAHDLVYLDVTTPMLRDEGGADLLDTRIFLAAAPAPARALLRRFLLQDILDKYHSPRGVLMDLLANLYKEDLAQLVPLFLEHQADWVEPALSLREVRRYYRSDARIWALWQSLRRADRWWQLTVRRRSYPFLLPGQRIERHV